MPNSAEKVRQAMEARRQAAQRNAANRRARTRKAATPASALAPASAGAGASQETAAPVVAPDPVLGKEDLQDEALASAESLFDNASSEAEVEELCELVETNPNALGPQTNTVRHLCRNRRQALATKGKAAIPAKRSTNGGTGLGGMGLLAFSASNSRGRDVARQRRAEKASIGRGNKPKARPTRPPREMRVPPKVEVGTTLAGQEVTGTQVERNVVVTGNEQGTCRPVTGTEYIGSEQFNEFCGAQPEANPPKVGISVTGAGEPVTGTEVGRSDKVTGDEHGSCVQVTGSEYVGMEKMADFCGTKPSAKPAKVMSSRTEGKQLRVTGSDEARANQTTGSEAGAQLQITGSQYADTGMAKMTINGPQKVALTHTIAGQPVTGTEVGRSAQVTGDEYGSCRPVTGTEYLSNEQFQSVCQTIPEPHPAKVGVDNSQQGQRITGALVDRTEKVTGNEPGSCKRLTGTQYGESRLCGGAAPKVQDMQTLSGNSLTGTGVDLSPKMTGDEQGGCLPVTGTEYYGQQQFANCPSTPAAQPAKVGVDHTPMGQHVSGTMVSAADNVTGNEHGANLPVSGTPYAGVHVPHNHGSCCDACAARDMAEAAGLIAPGSAQHAQPAAAAPAPAPMQMQAPQAAVAPAPIAPAPVAAPQYPVQQAVPVAAPAAPQDFSILSPARAAHITGSRYGGSRVTGPGDLAMNRVSGTPEFRYPELRHVAPPPPAPVMAAPVQPEAMPEQQAVAAAPTRQPADSVVMHSQRITGEGREDGVAVTGDNWGRGRSMTGTEGHVVQGRNPSLRGAEMHQPANNAHLNKGIERPDAPVAQVTGSSGNTNEGAVITVSGGARG